MFLEVVWLYSAQFESKYRSSFSVWILAVIPSNIWLISSWEDKKCCYKLSKYTKWHLFHSKRSTYIYFQIVHYRITQPLETSRYLFLFRRIFVPTVCFLFSSKCIYFMPYLIMILNTFCLVNCFFHGIDLQIDANNLNLELIMKISTFGL